MWKVLSMSALEHKQNIHTYTHTHTIGSPQHIQSKWLFSQNDWILIRKLPWRGSLSPHSPFSGITCEPVFTCDSLPALGTAGSLRLWWGTSACRSHMHAGYPPVSNPLDFYLVIQVLIHLCMILRGNWRDSWVFMLHLGLIPLNIIHRTYLSFKNWKMGGSPYLFYFYQPWHEDTLAFSLATAGSQIRLFYAERTINSGFKIRNRLEYTLRSISWRDEAFTF